MSATTGSGASVRLSQTAAPIFDGRTPFFACPADRRFSYCAYCPRSRPPEALLVVIHGSARSAEGVRDLFIPYSERSGTALLAPLFPIGALEDDDEPAYKFLKWENTRFDEILLSMVADAAARYAIPADRFQLFGFSGGAQLAQRMLFTCPSRIRSVSVVAPGYVTLLDVSKPWWAGTSDFSSVFGFDLPTDEIRRVPVQVVVGSADAGAEEIFVPPASRLWVEGANEAGQDRVARARTLQHSMSNFGIEAELQLLEGIGHELDERIMTAVVKFLSQT